MGQPQIEITAPGILIHYMSRIILLSLCLNRVLPLRAGMISAAIIMYSLRGSGVQRKSLVLWSEDQECLPTYGSCSSTR
jgi:hypothetical protein